MTYETIAIHIQEHVAKLTFMRSDKHNAFNPQMIEEILSALEDIKSTEARVLVIDAEGKSFSAGADLNWMKEASAYSHDENLQDAERLSELMMTLYTYPIPTIACVQGATYGGGVGLVACCDVAIAKETAVFCLSEVKVGLIPAVIAPYVNQAIGPRQIRRYMQSAEVISANKALQMGLVHEVCKDFDEKLSALIGHFLIAGPYALMKCKELMGEIPEIVREKTVKIIADIRQTEEAKEGLEAFFEKRSPDWVKG